MKVEGFTFAGFEKTWGPYGMKEPYRNNIPEHSGPCAKARAFGPKPCGQQKKPRHALGLGFRGDIPWTIRSRKLEGSEVKV